MLISDEDREWIDARADELFRESERQRGGIRPNTVMPQDYRDYFVVQAAWERAEKHGAERMRDRAAQYHDNFLMTCTGISVERIVASTEALRALPLTKETPDAE